jgi:hypothetical protein
MSPSCLQIREFLHFPSVLRLSFAAVLKQTALGSVNASLSPVRALCRRISQSNGFAVFSKVFIVAAILPSLFWSPHLQGELNRCIARHGVSACSGRSAYVQEVFTFLFLLGNVVELTVRILAHPNDSPHEHSLRTFIRWLQCSYWNVYDFIVIVWSVLSSIALLTGSPHTQLSGAVGMSCSFAHFVLEVCDPLFFHDCDRLL